MSSAQPVLSVCIIPVTPHLNLLRKHCTEFTGQTRKPIKKWNFPWIMPQPEGVQGWGYLCICNLLCQGTPGLWAFVVELAERRSTVSGLTNQVTLAGQRIAGSSEISFSQVEQRLEKIKEHWTQGESKSWSAPKLLLIHNQKLRQNKTESVTVWVRVSLGATSLVDCILQNFKSLCPLTQEDFEDCTHLDTWRNM